MRKIQMLLVNSLLLISSQAAVAECLITGCNNEICSDIAQGRVGVCIWKPEYQCYQQYGVCAADGDGNCAWQQTPELQACLTKLQQELEGAPFTPGSIQ